MSSPMAQLMLFVCTASRTKKRERQHKSHLNSAKRLLLWQQAVTGLQAMQIAMAQDVRSNGIGNTPFQYDGPPALNCDNRFSDQSLLLTNYATNKLHENPIAVRGEQISILTCATPNIQTNEVLDNIKDTESYAKMHGYHMDKEFRDSDPIWEDAWRAAMHEEKNFKNSGPPKPPEKGIPHPRWNSYAKLYTMFAERDYLEYIFYLDADNHIARPDIALQTLIAMSGLHINRSVTITLGTTKNNTRYGLVPRFQGSTIIFRRTKWTLDLLRGVVGLGWGVHRWVPEFMLNDKWLRTSLHNRIEYFPGLSGYQMNQNLWTAIYYHDWQSSRTEICAYKIPQLNPASGYGASFRAYIGSSIFPIRLFCDAGDDIHVSKEDDRIDPELINHCFAHPRRSASNWTAVVDFPEDLARANGKARKVDPQGKGRRSLQKAQLM